MGSVNVAGGYKHKGKAQKYELYRFESPDDSAFPPKIELLSRRPEYLADIKTHLGRFQTIHAEGSLSAILLDDEYYGLLEVGITEIAGLPVLSLDYLPVFKIHAWTNLTNAKASGVNVNSDEINKHRRDTLRLGALFEPGHRVEISEAIRSEIEQFISVRPWDDNMMRNLKLSASADGMADIIRGVYFLFARIVTAYSQAAFEVRYSPMTRETSMASRRQA